MNVNDFNGVNLDTAIFDEIIDDNSIEKLCNIINDFVPSQFSNLSDCGLFLNGLNSITSNVSSILESVKSLKTQIKVHKESIIDIENGRDVSIAQIPEINVEDNSKND